MPTRIRIWCTWVLYFTFFFFNDTATTEIYTLSLHDALPISHVPPDALEHAQDVLALELLHRLPERRAGVLGEARARVRQRDVERDVLELDDVALREHDRAMHDVLQLAHVPRPVVARQHLERARRHAPHVAVALARGLPDEVLDEERNVLAPLAERRHVDRPDVPAIVEVLTELARPHRGLEVDVGRGDDAPADRDGPQPAEALHLALLEGAEELRLEVQAQRADLVEEHRPAVGELELPELAGVGPGERALLVAEELRLDQRVGDGGDVHGDERLA